MSDEKVSDSDATPLPSSPERTPFRRRFLTGLAAGAAAVLAPRDASAQDDGRASDVRDHGAVGDGRADDSNVTFTNHFFENNNRANRSAALLLETAPRPAGPAGPERRRARHPLMRVVNITGGFITPGSNGHGPAVKIGDYFVINIMGLDVRGARLQRGLHLYGAHSRVNIIGTMSRLENVIRSPHRNIIGSVMEVSDA